MEATSVIANATQVADIYLLFEYSKFHSKSPEAVARRLSATDGGPFVFLMVFLDLNFWQRGSIAELELLYHVIVVFSSLLALC